MSKMHKKFTALTAATVAASVLVPVASANSEFSDIPSTYNFHDEVVSLAGRGIVKGFEDGTFRPGDSVTRGQAAKIIAGILNLDTENVKNPGFKDIPTTHQYYGAIAALSNAGIISGYEDGTYRSGEPVQRNHMAKIIAKAFELQATPGYLTPLTDVRSDYMDYVNALHEFGVTTGKTSTTFDGSSNVTRGQLVAFVVRAEKAMEEAGNEVTFTISEVAGTTVKAKDATYEVATELQGIFSSSNAEVLKGAVLKAKVVDNEIVSIVALELNAGGQEGTFATLNGGNATIDGNLIVNADYIEVKNVTVKGNVTLTDQVVNEFGGDGLTTEGELIIDEANVEPVAVASLTPIAVNLNKGPKVNLKNSKVNKVNAKRDNVAIESDTKITEIVVSASVASIQVDADVTKVTINVDVNITVTGTGNIDEVAVEKASEIALNVVGKIAKLAVNNTTTKVEVATSVKITKLVVPKGTEAKDVISNYDEVSNNIEEVETSDEASDTASEEESSGGSGGSGGGSSNDRDDDDDDDSYPVSSGLSAYSTLLAKSVTEITLADESLVENALSTYYSLTVAEQEAAATQLKLLIAYLEQIATLKINAVNGQFSFSSYDIDYEGQTWKEIAFKLNAQPSSINLYSMNGSISNWYLSTSDSMTYTTASGEGNLGDFPFYLELGDVLYKLTLKDVEGHITINTIKTISTFEDVVNAIQNDLNSTEINVSEITDVTKINRLESIISSYINNLFPGYNSSVNIGADGAEITLSYNGQTGTILVDNSVFKDIEGPNLLSTYSQVSGDTLTFTFNESLYEKNTAGSLELASMNLANDLFVIQDNSGNVTTIDSAFVFFLSDDRTQLTVDFSNSSTSLVQGEFYTIRFDRTRGQFYDEAGNELEGYLYIEG